MRDKGAKGTGTCTVFLHAWRVRFDRDAADLVAAAQWLSSDGADAGEVPDVLVSWCREVFRASPAFRERLLECLDADDDGGVL